MCTRFTLSVSLDTTIYAGTQCLCTGTTVFKEIFLPVCLVTLINSQYTKHHYGNSNEKATQYKIIVNYPQTFLFHLPDHSRPHLKMS